MYMDLRKLFKTPLIIFFVSVSYICDAKPISIAFTFSMPPYLNGDMKSGIERDIIYEAMNASDIQLGEVHNVHYKRAIKMLEQGHIDGIVSNMANNIYNELVRKPYPSSKTIDYVDCAITFSKQKLKLATVQDYDGKIIWAFKTAKTTLGDEFEVMANNNPQYTEDTDQSMQAEMLALGRIDVAISDRNIFTSKLRQDGKYQTQDFEFQAIGTPTPRALRFSNKEHLESFNSGLAKIKTNGDYAKILTRYKDHYTSSCN